MKVRWSAVPMCCPFSLVALQRERLCWLRDQQAWQRDRFALWTLAGPVICGEDLGL